MKETIVNIYPLLKFVIILFAVVGGLSTVNNFMYLLARYGKDKLDFKKDTEVIKTLSSRDVKIITVQNTRELHTIRDELDNEIIKRIEVLEKNTLGEQNGK